MPSPGLNGIAAALQSLLSNTSVTEESLNVPAMENELGYRLAAGTLTIAPDGSISIRDFVVDDTLTVSGNVTFGANLSVAGVLSGNGAGLTSVIAALSANTANTANTANAANTANTANNSTFAFGKSEGALNVNSAVTALTANNSTNFNGQPASFYANASNLVTGAVPPALLPVANTTVNGVVDTTAQSFAGIKTFTANVVIGDHVSGNGVSLTTLNASSLSTGTVPTSVLGTGTANSNTYLAGNNTWNLFPIASNTVNGFMATTNQSFSGLKTFVNTCFFGPLVTNLGPGMGAIAPAPGSPYSVQIQFGTDNSGWRLGFEKNANGTVTQLAYLIDNGYFALTTGSYFERGRTSAAIGEWNTWSPTIGCDTGSWSVGSGSVSGLYMRVGDTVFIDFDAENTTTTGSPTTLVIANLPVNLTFAPSGHVNPSRVIPWYDGQWHTDGIVFPSTNTSSDCIRANGATWTAVAGFYMRMLFIGRTTG